MQEETKIDLNRIFFILFKRAWLIVLAVTLAAGAAYLGTRFLAVPQYTAGIRLYVNNSIENNTDISSSDLTASQSLVDTYITIIRSDAVLDAVARITGLPYSARQIDRMISAGSINGTEVFAVSITGPDADEAAGIANAIAEIASDKIAEIVTGSSVKIVDDAKVPTEPSSPNFMLNMAAGGLIGLALTVGILLLRDLLDTRIKTEADLENISDLPVLGTVSEFSRAEKEGAYGYACGAGGRVRSS